MEKVLGLEAYISLVNMIIGLEILGININSNIRLFDIGFFRKLHKQYKKSYGKATFIFTPKLKTGFHFYIDADCRLYYFKVSILGFGFIYSNREID